ncbi:NFX1-type zinc finger-containing protein 1 [Pseudolycoriella hygida]|uniref:NFX1-type zinc finger-containing protein 1 n=1 Tax=Pseudolycoriella hygida TaxID=35572 RepID=A0A9Q0NFE7_9DIPT|nr:NFX1-type zinc finger-containing protein 1 [Pseudolycoriella hygida]
MDGKSRRIFQRLHRGHRSDGEQQTGHHSKNWTDNRRHERGFNDKRRSYETHNAFGLKRLSEFLTQTNDEVIMAIDKSNHFKTNLKNCTDDVIMVLLIEIIGEKICGETSLPEFQNRLVALSIESTFLEKILKFTSKIPSIKDVATNSMGSENCCPVRLLNALSSFYGRLCARMPTFAVDTLLPFIESASNISELLSLKGVLPNDASVELLTRFESMIKEINSMKETARMNSTADFRKKIRKRVEISDEDRGKLYQMTPVDDFREIAIVPSTKEIISDEEPFLRPNLIKGKYPSASTYLDVQFRLLREDFMVPLRESVKHYFASLNTKDHKEHRPAPGTIRIYKDVELHNVHSNVDVTLFTMKFSTFNLKRVKWETSKRLLTGSLLLLTSDNFKKIFFATVGQRDDKKLPQGLIDIVWEGDRPLTYENVKFLMIESEVYFESYRHTLKALQIMAETAPPYYVQPRLQAYKMSKYIVDVTKDPIPPPDYLRNDGTGNAVILDFGMILQVNQEPTKLPEMKINPLALTDWPSATDLGMDEPQYAAFQAAITQEIAIIQGPPGTGKTYIGLQIMNLLLANAKKIDHGPILIVCYTNHALDQFLEGILSIMDKLKMNPYGKLVRVGGQSKVEDMQPYNIRNIRSEFINRKQFSNDYGTLRSRTRHQLTLLLNCRTDFKSIFTDLCRPNGIINFWQLNKQLQNYDLEICEEFDIASLMHGECQQIFFEKNGSKLLDFLRLNNSEFESRTFSAEKILKYWFQITRKPITRKVEAAVQEVSEADEFEDEELLSILFAQRMEEEILEEDRKYTAARLEYHLSPHQEDIFQSRENTLYSQLQEAQKAHDRQQIRYLEGYLYELGLQRNKFRNQCNFIRELYQKHSDGLIVLPEITPSKEKASIWRLPVGEKWAIYFRYIDGIKKYLLSELIKIEEKIIEAQKEMDDVKNKGDGIILQQAKVVGMTTTGAAKYNSVLDIMKSKIVIVEEAAEVLEAHIVTSITKHCEHLILIGDHQQLRPPTTVYKLARDYQLDVSLFERLIHNDISWKNLRTQHRMSPNICQLLVPTIYRDLENHSNVYEYPPVNGLAKNLFFITHTNPEKADNDSMTKLNEYEANFVTQLCRHLILQGYKPDQITILTTYIGQMFLVKKLKMQEGDTCKGVRVTVVDNFQGEENDIIILSLVRSNEENKIGFLRTDNRICVALSRAKHGFYIVGNMDCLVNSPSATWKKISEELERQGSIGTSIPIKCRNHEEIIEIKSPEEFRQKSPEGGCTKMCPGVLPRCDHACRKICHIIDRFHELYNCPERCERRCPDTEQHKCPYVCSIYPCPPCNVKMERILPCGHVTELSCHIDIDNYECDVQVIKQLKCEHAVHLLCSSPIEEYRCTTNVQKELDCGHVKSLPCYIPVTEYECVEMVKKDLACGHKAVMKCIDDPAKFICKRKSVKNLPCKHEQLAPCKEDATSVKCLTLFEEVNPYCNHKIQVPCHALTTPTVWKCKENCDTRLNCGHQCLRTCHMQDDPYHANYLCKKNCVRHCINYHPCEKVHPCHENCDPCKKKTNRTRSCGHEMTASCSVDVEKIKCTQPCDRLLSCFHKCVKSCSDTCGPCTTLTIKKSVDCGHTIEIPCYQKAEKANCNELVRSAKMSSCGHVVKVPCRISESCTPQECLQFCRQPCDYKFDYDGGCGHTCQGDCASCHQKRIHVKCKSKCERVLACGHICKFPCSSLCPPCKDQCVLRCEHSKCKKRCGEPCIDCKERCKWSCEHLKCQKKCSELCDRPPCDEPCKKKVKKCDHDCIGHCGEPCPPFCRICDKDLVQNILFGNEDQEDARFVYLENCGHIIHREAMDTWMAQKSENSGSTQINVKRCPLCSQIIEKSVRYANIIKKQFNDILGIRNKVFGNNSARKGAQYSIAQKIQLRENQMCQFNEVKNFLKQKLFRIKQINDKRQRRWYIDLIDVDQYAFESLHNIFLWWEEAENAFEHHQKKHQKWSYREHLLPESKVELFEMYNKMFDILLTRTLPLSNHEISDFDQVR